MKRLNKSNPCSNPSDSKKEKLAKGSRTSTKGVTKQWIAQNVQAQIPKLSKFNFMCFI